MIALLQRVRSATVTVGGKLAGEIGPGLLVLAAVERGDCEAGARRLAERVTALRVFPDQRGRMNRSLLDSHGDLLLVPQFTLAADTRRGNRPGFEPAAAPADGRRLFDYLKQELVTRLTPGGLRLACGVFGADMDVALVNQGPVTFWLQVPPDEASNRDGARPNSGTAA